MNCHAVKAENIVPGVIAVSPFSDQCVIIVSNSKTDGPRRRLTVIESETGEIKEWSFAPHHKVVVL